MGMDSTTLSVGNRLDWIVTFNSIIKLYNLHTHQAMDVDITQCRILFQLALINQIPIGSIATTLSLKASTTTAAVNILERKEFIERISNDTDRRSTYLKLTDTGKESLISMIGYFARLFNSSAQRLESEFSPYILDILTSDIKKMVIHSKLTREELISRILSNSDNLSHDEVSSFLDFSFLIENMCYYCCKLSNYDHNSSVSPNDSKVLRCLGNAFPDPLSVREIGKHIAIKPNITTVTLNNLLSEGYIQKSPNATDKRSSIINLTDTGISFLEEHNDGYIKLFDSYYPGLNRYLPNEVAKRMK